MTKKNIAIVKMNLSASGGLEKQTNLIVNALTQKGFSISFITTKPKSALPFQEKISFHFVKRWPLFSFLRILFFNAGANRWVKKNRPDITLGIDRTTNQTHIRAGNGVHRAYLENRKKYFGLFDFVINKLNPLHYLVLYIEKKAFQNRELKKIIVNSNMVKSEIIKHYNIDPKKIAVIHNGVEWEKNKIAFERSFEVKNTLAKNLQLNPSKFTFLFVGNGFKRKGLDKVLQAASLIKNKNDFQLIIVGKDKNIAKYKKYAATLGLKPNIFFFGLQPSLETFYQISDCLILPSYYDPFANVTLEALSMGLFTITSKENGAHEIIDEENGLIINDLNNINEILSCIVKAMEKKKRVESAKKIRDSVKHLDASFYLEKIIDTLITDEQI